MSTRAGGLRDGRDGGATGTIGFGGKRESATGGKISPALRVFPRMALPVDGHTTSPPS
jgi:hypothetical protein